MKKIAPLIFLIILFFGGYFFVSQQKSSVGETENNNNNSQVILFYGETCPHCKIVEEWLNKNPQIEQKSGLIRKEVYNDKKNAQELTKKARECKINESQGIGVPFLYDSGKCVIGDQPIIDYFSSKYQ